MRISKESLQTMKTKMEYDALHKAIIKSASEKRPITDLVENWLFTVEEITLGRYEAKGRDAWYMHSAFGYGNTAENALLACVEKANKIVGRENRKKRIKDMLERIFGIQD